MKSELTPRQWKLYNFLKDNPNKTFKQIDIANEMSDEYGWTIDRVNLGTVFHDSAARKKITNDIRAINNSKIIQKIIISTVDGIRIANREEFALYIARQYAAIFRKLERTRRKAIKGGLDGQIRIVFGNERDSVESFID